MKNNNLDEKVEIIIAKLKELPKDTETSMTQLLGPNYLIEYTDNELTEMYYKFYARYTDEKIKLEYQNSNEKTGLIYNLPFIKK